MGTLHVTLDTRTALMWHLARTPPRTLSLRRGRRSLSTDYNPNSLRTLCCGSRARTVQEGRVHLFIVILGLQHGVALEVRVLELLIRLFAQLGGERAIEEEDPNTAC